MKGEEEGDPHHQDPVVEVVEDSLGKEFDRIR